MNKKKPHTLEGRLAWKKRTLDIIDARRIREADGYIGSAVERRIIQEELDDLTRLMTRARMRRFLGVAASMAVGCGMLLIFGLIPFRMYLI